MAHLHDAVGEEPRSPVRVGRVRAEVHHEVIRLGAGRHSHHETDHQDASQDPCSYVGRVSSPQRLDHHLNETLTFYHPSFAMTGIHLSIRLLSGWCSSHGGVVHRRSTPLSRAIHPVLASQERPMVPASGETQVGGCRFLVASLRTMPQTACLPCCGDPPRASGHHERGIQHLGWRERDRFCRYRAPRVCLGTASPTQCHEHADRYTKPRSLRRIRYQSTPAPPG